MFSQIELARQCDDESGLRERSSWSGFWSSVQARENVSCGAGAVELADQIVGGQDAGGARWCSEKVQVGDRPGLKHRRLVAVGQPVGVHLPHQSLASLRLTSSASQRRDP